MKFKKKGAAFSAAAIMALGVGTTAVAAGASQIGSISDRSVVIGTKGEAERDGISKISFDLGSTWVDEGISENAADYWTYGEYKAYAEAMARELQELYAAGEPGLNERDIREWEEEAVRMLALIKAGGRRSKNKAGCDSEIMISGLDGSLIESVREEK